MISWLGERVVTTTKGHRRGRQKHATGGLLAKHICIFNPLSTCHCLSRHGGRRAIEYQPRLCISYAHTRTQRRFERQASAERRIRPEPAYRTAKAPPDSWAWPGRLKIPGRAARPAGIAGRRMSRAWVGWSAAPPVGCSHVLIALINSTSFSLSPSAATTHQQPPPPDPGHHESFCRCSSYPLLAFAQ